MVRKENATFVLKKSIMEWAETTKIIKTVKRFAGKEIRAVRYSTDGRHTSYKWRYDNASKMLRIKTEGEELALSEEEVEGRFESDFWRMMPFVFLREEKERALAVRMVERLMMAGDIDWVIDDCRIDFLRSCHHCGRLIDEGWWCSEMWVFCSKECLRAANPFLSKEEEERMEETDGGIEWMEWGERH